MVLVHRTVWMLKSFFFLTLSMNVKVILFNKDKIIITTLMKLTVLQLIFKRKLTTGHTMAKSAFEYVKNYETDDKLLPNTWIVVRVDGKNFHKFSEEHEFDKPNDLKALRLMNYAACSVLKEYNDVLMAFGSSDEYSFILRKNTTLYNRRAAKLLTNINSKFSTSYVYYWNKFFDTFQLKYPPVFDGRVVLYPCDKNLIDYIKWRQADVHINNLYNTTFWKLVVESKMSPNQAEKRLCGTVSADKHEILFKEFNTNYNQEPEIFKRGTLLIRKALPIPNTNNSLNVIVDGHNDMLKDKFWEQNAALLHDKYRNNIPHNDEITDIVREQLVELDKEYLFSCNK